MKKAILIILFFTFNMTDVTEAGSPEKAQVAALRSKLESSGLVLLFYSSIPLGYYLAATPEQMSSVPTWNADSLLPPLSQEDALRAAHKNGLRVDF